MCRSKATRFTHLTIDFDSAKPKEFALDNSNSMNKVKNSEKG